MPCASAPRCKGLFVIVDARRGLKDGDEDLLDWAQPEH